MKKLITFLLGLTLCLCMGTAFADIIPPTFIPEPNSTVRPGQEIKVSVEKEYSDYGFIILVWSFDPAVSLDDLKFPDDMDALQGKQIPGVNLSMCMRAGGFDDDDLEGFVIENWMSAEGGIFAPENAQGNIALRARLALANDSDGPFETTGTVTANYTVEGEAIGIPVPTFTPEGGAVELDAIVKLSVEPAEGNFTHNIAYVVDNEDIDFTQYMGDQVIGEGGTPAGKLPISMLYPREGIVIDYAKTITAATYKMSVISDAIVGWGDKVTVSYTIIPPVAPEFNPDGGQVEADAQIALTTTTEKAKIYFARDATAATFTDIKTTDELNQAEALNLYNDEDKFTLEGLGAEGGKTVKVLAATAQISGQNVIWSTVVEKTFTVLGNSADLIITPAEEAKIGDIVTITGPEGATVYYTTDGSVPSAQSTPYAAPFAITEDMLNANLAVVIRAVAIKDGEEAFRRANLQIIPTNPVFSPAAGEVRNGTEITLSSVPAAADIYYTLDGTEPTAESYRYTQPIAIEKNLTIKACAFMQQQHSEVVEAVYTVTEIPQPVFTPAGGLVKAGQELECTINYDLKHDELGQVFVIYVENNDEVKLETTFEDLMNAVYPGNQTTPVELPYKVAACAWDEDNEAYVWTRPVELSKNVPDEFSFRARTVVLVKVEAEDDEDSDNEKYIPDYSQEIKTYYYTALPVPGFANAGEVLQGEALNVNFPKTLDLSVYLNQAFILYAENDNEVELTYNGTVAELQALAQGGGSVDPLAKTAGLPYKVAVYEDEFGGSWNPAIYLTELGEVNVRACLAVGTSMDGQLMYSDEFTATYTVTERPVPDEPLFLVDNKVVTASSVEVVQGTAVGFESGYEDEMDDEYIVFYVVNGKDEDFANAMPTAIFMGNSAVKMYDPFLPQTFPVVNEAQTIKAATGLLLESGAIWWSEIVTVSFTVKAPVVAAPTFSIAAGQVEKGTKVTLAGEKDATIYYTLTYVPEKLTEATEYQEAIVINEDVTITAWAVKGEAKSEEVSATYTVKPEDSSANEDEELAGVTVYPNPSNGLLHISLPVAASIEVFMSNGMLYQRINANAGETTLNINRSGIYFLRITGEGRTAIKRVIIR